MRFSVCIPTHRRNAQLSALLDDLAAQRRIPDEVVVVDNTRDGEARPVVEEHRARAPFPIRYAIQPQQNISLTRNRSVELAGGDWLAFIDDDERAGPEWLATLAQFIQASRPDAVLAPVVPVVPADAPRWIRHGKFYDWPRMPTGTRVPGNRLRFGNAAIRGELLRTDPAPFDPAYGLTGGEDGALLGDLARRGAAILWCDEAVVREPVESSRLTLRWLALRALRGGQDYSRHILAGRHGPVGLARLSFLSLRWCAQMLAAAGLVPLSLPLGSHHAAHWVTKVTANFGKLSYLCGWHYAEYARRAMQ